MIALKSGWQVEVTDKGGVRLWLQTESLSDDAELRLIFNDQEISSTPVRTIVQVILLPQLRKYRSVECHCCLKVFWIKVYTYRSVLFENSLMFFKTFLLLPLLSENLLQHFHPCHLSEQHFTYSILPITVVGVTSYILQ